MGGEWLSTTWGELVELKYGKALKGYKNAKGHFPVYGTNGPVGSCDMPLCEYPSIVVGRKGAYRGIHYSPTPFYVIDTAFYIEPKTDVNLKWAYYSLLTQDINGLDSGSAIPSTRKEDFYALQASVPPQSIQDSIVDHLDALNDKIELNRRMNATLEGIAQALLKSWFADFDPVIDKALAAGNPIPEPLKKRAEVRRALGDRRKPLPATIAQHFPSRFVFNEEMGWVPEGWEIAQIKERADAIEYGLTASASDEPIGPRFLRITDIRGGSVNWETVPYCNASDTDIEKYRINKGDIFVARTGASTGENIYIFDPPVCVFASYLVRFVFKDIAIGRIVGMYMRTKAYFSFIEGVIGGSAQPNASAQVLASSNLVFPSSRISDEFYKVIALYDQKRSKIERQTATLSNLRDTLLPKLLSGQLRIPDAEKLIEEAL